MKLYHVILHQKIINVLFTYCFLWFHGTDLCLKIVCAVWLCFIMQFTFLGKLFYSKRFISLKDTTGWSRNQFHPWIHIKGLWCIKNSFDCTVRFKVFWFFSCSENLFDFLINPEHDIHILIKTLDSRRKCFFSLKFYK